MGRPPKPPAERKAAALTLRLTLAEREAAEAAAKAAGADLSDWIRRIVAEAAQNGALQTDAAFRSVRRR